MGLADDNCSDATDVGGVAEVALEVGGVDKLALERDLLLAETEGDSGSG